MQNPEVKFKERLSMEYQRKREEILQSYEEGDAIEHIAWKVHIEPKLLEQLIKKEANHKILKENREKNRKKIHDFDLHIL